jgi:hypothetical protein
MATVTNTQLKPYTKKELAIFYKVSTYCFSTMISNFQKEIGKKKGWYYSVKQVQIIFEKLGYPDCFLSDEFDKRA